MRCGGRVIGKGINQGISMAEVQQRCGQPYDVYGNQWLYVIGNNVFRVYFNRNGDVRKVVSEIVR